MVEWGDWESEVKFRFVPYSKYYQSFLAKIFYKIWSWYDSVDTYLINFLYHGELSIPQTSAIFYVLHSPATLIPKRYDFIQVEYQKNKNLKFISVSKFVKKSSEPYFPSNSNSVIHHGIDFEKINQKTEYRNNGKLKILTVAALESWKGIQHVISAFNSTIIQKNFVYHIIGEGPYREALYQEIIKYNVEDHVSFLGCQNKIESLYCNYDIYCQLSDGEAFGLSVIEAMSAGLPTIVYDIPPFDSLFQSDMIIKLDKNNDEDLRNNLLDLLSLRERQKIGVRGQKYVSKHFTLEKMANNYYDLLKH